MAGFWKAPSHAVFLWCWLTAGLSPFSWEIPCHHREVSHSRNPAPPFMRGLLGCPLGEEGGRASLEWDLALMWIRRQ